MKVPESTVEDSTWWPLSHSPPDEWELTGRTSELHDSDTGQTLVLHEIRPIFDIKELTE